MIIIMESFANDYLNDFVRDHATAALAAAGVDKLYKIADKYVNNVDKQKHFILARSLTLGPDSTWAEAFGKVSEKIRIKVPPERAGATMSSPSSPSGSVDPKTKNEVPMPLKPSLTMLDARSAWINARSYRFTLEAMAAMTTMKMTGAQILNNSRLLTQAHAVEAKMKKNKEEAGNDVLMVVLDVFPTDSIFNSDVGGNRILQAYSYRLGGAAEGHVHNPGIPTCWDVSFPDVMSFDVEYDFKTAVTGIVNVMASQAEAGSAAASMMEEAKAVEGVSSDKDLTKQTPAPKELKTEAEKTAVADERAKTVARSHSSVIDAQAQYKNNGYNLPMRLDSDKGLVYSSAQGDVVAARRDMQELRKRILLEAMSYDATIKILGDPGFDLVSMGKYIFLKFIMPDGSLGYFTGVYVLEKATHEVSSAGFFTTLKVKREATAGNDALSAEIFKAAYGRDDLVIDTK